MSTQNYFAINEEAKRITFYNYDNVSCQIGKSDFLFSHDEHVFYNTSTFKLAKEICEDNGKAAILNKNHEDNRIRELCKFRLLLISEKVDFNSEKVLKLEAGRYLK